MGVRHSLRPHPLSTCAAIESIDVDIGVPEPRRLAVDYRIVGRLDALAIPRTPLDPERLWAHTCAELFVGAAEAEAYVEYNFSPTGQVAGFAFDRYRRRGASAPPAATTRVSVDATSLCLHAEIPLGLALGERLRLSTTVVIEDAAGELSYWALRHPRDQPDFHHRDGFALALTLGPSPTLVEVSSP